MGFAACCKIASSHQMGGCHVLRGTSPRTLALCLCMGGPHFAVGHREWPYWQLGHSAKGLGLELFIALMLWGNDVPLTNSGASRNTHTFWVMCGTGWFIKEDLATFFFPQSLGRTEPFSLWIFLISSSKQGHNGRLRFFQEVSRRCSPWSTAKRPRFEWPKQGTCEVLGNVFSRLLDGFGKPFF